VAALVRSERQSQHLDWLPRSFQVRRRVLIIGFAVATAALAFSLAHSASVWVMFAIFGVVSVLGEVAQNRLLGRLNRADLNRLVKRADTLRQLAAAADGERVRVRGRILLRGEGVESEPGWNIPPKVVHACRAELVMSQRDFVVHERGVDFFLVDGSGEEIFVEIEGARLVSPQLFGERAASGQILKEGDTVDVVGVKKRRVDQTVTDRLERQEPMRTVLRSGADLPLLIIPIVEERALAGAQRKALPER
jgi:hypothetical protein